MARGWSGAIVRPNGRIFVGPVLLPDRRAQGLRDLLVDLSHPNVCIVLGAGASHGVVPITPKEVTAIAWKILQASRSVPVLSVEEHATFARFPEVRFLAKALQSMPTGSWDRFVLDALSPGRAVVILSDVFSPQTEVPSALIKIYDVIENTNGVLISFNYDGIDQRQSRFRVIAPHGRRPDLLFDPVYGPSTRELVETFRVDVPTNWHLPIPESERVLKRPAYPRLVSAASLALAQPSYGVFCPSRSFLQRGYTALTGAERARQLWRLSLVTPSGIEFGHRSTPDAGLQVSGAPGERPGSRIQGLSRLC
jgi:hypothetical protein